MSDDPKYIKISLEQTIDPELQMMIALDNLLMHFGATCNDTQMLRALESTVTRYKEMDG